MYGIREEAEKEKRMWERMVWEGTRETNDTKVFQFPKTQGDRFSSLGSGFIENRNYSETRRVTFSF